MTDKECISDGLLDAFDTLLKLKVGKAKLWMIKKIFDREEDESVTDSIPGPTRDTIKMFEDFCKDYGFNLKEIEKDLKLSGRDDRDYRWYNGNAQLVLDETT